MCSKVIIFTLLALTESAKILVVIPTPSVSHQIVLRPLVHELAKRGHEVTFITTDPAYPDGGAPNNLREIDLHELSYTMWVKWFKESGNLDQNDFLSKLEVAYRLLTEVFTEQLRDKRVQEIIRNKENGFDLIITEPLVKPAMIFSHIFKAPLILMSTFGACPGNMELIGAATHPFLYPMTFHRRIYNLSIVEKVNELYKDVQINQIIEKQEIEDNKMLQALFGKDVPSLKELKKNVHMLFLNVHPIWVHNQPVPPNVVYTWGIHRTPEKPLPKDLRSYLDSSENVIYISFGTNFNTSSMPSRSLEVFLKVLSRLPYNVLLKWDAEELPGKPENIKISKWLPQVDVLRHSNVKLFITQGGLQSTDESILAGVPLIGVPVLGDQEYNSEKYEHFKIGLKLKLSTITEEQLENAIKTIFYQYERYKKNIIHLRTIMQDTPKPPLENAIWWIEHALRHGGARHLQTPAANMHWTEYYEIKLVFILLCGLVTFVIMLSILVYYSVKLILSKLRTSSVKPKVS